MRESVELSSWRQRGAVAREDAARILDISAAKVDDLRSSGELHSKRVGRRVLIPVWSIRSYLGEVLDEGAAPAPAPVLRQEMSPRVRRVLAEARRRLG